MKRQTPIITPDQLVRQLYVRVAGDKLAKCDELASKYMADGKTQNRAWADALEKLKLLPRPEVSEELN